MACHKKKLGAGRQTETLPRAQFCFRTLLSTSYYNEWITTNSWMKWAKEGAGNGKVVIEL